MKRFFKFFRRKKYSVVIIKANGKVVTEIENIFFTTFFAAEKRMKYELKKFISSGGNEFSLEKKEETNFCYARNHFGTIDIGISKIV